jgi:hypothetical protein
VKPYDNSFSSEVETERGGIVIFEIPNQLILLHFPRLVGFVLDFFESNSHLSHQKIHEQNIREEHVAEEKDLRKITRKYHVEIGRCLSPQCSAVQWTWLVIVALSVALPPDLVRLFALFGKLMHRAKIFLPEYRLVGILPTEFVRVPAIHIGQEELAKQTPSPGSHETNRILHAIEADWVSKPFDRHTETEHRDDDEQRKLGYVLQHATNDHNQRPHLVDGIQVRKVFTVSQNK